ncbi:MAG: YaaL family protein [Clostridium sp.]|uniref:YaaL family protein n=1 Tax=Clostridium sp. TaxID=1506 RepID=UPI003F2AE7B6
MNKSNFLEYIKSVVNGESDNVKILNAIDATKDEMATAKCIFDNVEDPLLIEAAIYAEQAAFKRYSYLMTLAKQRGITVNRDYILSKCFRFAE